MANIDYERSFKKLVKQIRWEMRWEEEYQKMADTPHDKTFSNGSIFAYSSIERLATKLEKGEFDFDEE